MPVFYHLFVRRRDKTTLDLLGEDCLMLGRLIYTLGTIMGASKHAPAAPQMAAHMMEFVWTLRYHTEPYVRRSLLFATAMVIVSIPGHFLMTDMQQEMLECRLWLIDIVERDADAECSQMAALNLSLFENHVKKELTINASLPT
ncbi:PREDICTED: telomere length regulation protein TEL2 homolog [Priapulus caudatus]|uniref:Telomere length regulation protein TEL2 homolog n=1 Tax=Priapulus caudatus TaxID=37621 RepID=A0ABM1DT63_PRICU|nr:PREDICTED: telomere length regulation protein TEL2 homolog [Priapulus caudatus]